MLVRVWVRGRLCPCGCACVRVSVCLFVCHRVSGWENAGRKSCPKCRPVFSVCRCECDMENRGKERCPKCEQCVCLCAFQFFARFEWRLTQTIVFGWTLRTDIITAQVEASHGFRMCKHRDHGRSEKSHLTRRNSLHRGKPNNLLDAVLFGNFATRPLE